MLETGSWLIMCVKLVSSAMNKILNLSKTNTHSASSSLCEYNHFAQCR